MNETNPPGHTQTPNIRRASIGGLFPESLQALEDLSTRAATDALDLGIPLTTIELVKVRSSQINNCASCLKTHVRMALEAGVTTDQLAVLSAWRDTRLFTDQERAALELSETITNVAVDAVPDEVYARVSDVLERREIAALAWVCIVINSFNRIGVTSRHPVS